MLQTRVRSRPKAAPSSPCQAARMRTQQVSLIAAWTAAKNQDASSHRAARRRIAPVLAIADDQLAQRRIKIRLTSGR
jgi:hypothetical protein